MKIVNLIGETYQVVENGEVLYQGSIANCQAYIQVNRGVEMKQEPVAYRVWCDCGDSIEPNTNAICGNCVTSMRTEPQYRELSDEELDIVSYAINSAICSLESEISEQEKTFKGYEHCSNLSGLREELNDCLKARAIIKASRGEE